MSENQGSPDTSGIESVVSKSLQEPSSGLNVETLSDIPHRCIVISLIRHAECEGNANKSWGPDDAPNPLTEEGRLQAETLGKNWANTHIDHLLSSPLKRAHDTAKALSNHNEGQPEIITNDWLIERRYGGRVHRLMNNGSPRAGSEELRGQSGYSTERPSRDHSPAEGGESMNMVARRAEAIIHIILGKYAANISEAPEFFLKKKKTDSPAVLPDGIPHVVIASHNVFLMELYEKLYSWGKEHLETNCQWENAEWSRHILWYDQVSNKLDVVDMKYCGGW